MHDGETTLVSQLSPATTTRFREGAAFLGQQRMLRENRSSSLHDVGALMSTAEDKQQISTLYKREGSFFDKRRNERSTSKLEEGSKSKKKIGPHKYQNSREEFYNNVNVLAAVTSA